MARSPALWIRVPNGGTPDNPAVYTAIRDSLREISEAVKTLQGGTTTVSASAAPAASSSSYSNTGPTLVTTAPATGYSGFRLPHGTAPSSPVNGDLWTTTSGLYAQINGTTVGPFSAATGVYLPLAGGTMTGLLTTAASGTSSAGFNLPHGAAPTTPVNGDLWTTTTGIYARINGTTVGPLAATPTGQALTRVNDTNVTVTLGGSPSTALLAATSLTLGWSGQLSLARGGTGADLSATGGTGQYVKQATAGGAFTVGTIPASDIASGAALTEVDDTNVTLTLGGTPASALLKAVSITAGWTGQLSIARGGTGQSTALAAFDALSPLTTLGDIIYHNGTDNVRLAGNTVNSKYFLTQTGTGTVSAAPSWGQVAAADIVTGQTLSKVDDTNVTLTLGGTPGSALLKSVSLTLGWTGTLAQTRGGFGANISSVLQNLVYASPNGSAGAPTFRSLVAADIPSLSTLYLPLTGGTMSGNINFGSGVGIVLTDGSITTGGPGTGTIDLLSAQFDYMGVGTTASSTIALNVLGSSTATATTYEDAALIQFRANPATSSTVQFSAIYSSLTAGQSASGAITGRARVIWGEYYNSLSAVTNASALFGNAIVSGTANVTNFTALHAGSPTATSTGRITGYAAGVYIDAQTGGAVTGTAYGVYQASTSDKNIFAGNTRIGSTVTAANALDVTGAATVSGNFTVDTTTLHVDSTNNRVGVGTAAPATVLDILQTTAGNAAVNMSNSSTDPAANARYILNNSATSGGLIIRSTGNVTEPSDMVLYSSANNIRFYTGGNNRMTVTSGGDLNVDSGTFYVDSANNRVGVGTTTPSVLAHFFQSTTGDAQVRLNNNNAGTAAVMTYLLTNGTANAGLEYTGASFATYPSRLKLYNGAAGGVVMESDNAAGFFSVCTGATFPTGERMRIKGDVKALTNNTNTSVISLGLSSGSFAGATIVYTIEATDGTNHQCASGIVHVAISRNTAGTFATGQVSNSITATSTTSGTLTVTWAAPTGADPSLVQVNANSSLAVSAGYPRIRYTVFRNGAGALNIL